MGIKVAHMVGEEKETARILKTVTLIQLLSYPDDIICQCQYSITGFMLTLMAQMLSSASLCRLWELTIARCHICPSRPELVACMWRRRRSIR